MNRWWDFSRMVQNFTHCLSCQITLWMFSDVIGLEVFARVKNIQMPVRATSVPSVTNTLAFLLRYADEAAATKNKNRC